MDDVLVTDDERPVAVALPGRTGGVVVSRGMLRQLRPAEQCVVFAHEESHRRRRHDRFIYTADLATAILPPLGILARKVRFATERWADEDAARVVGDRRLVAQAVARAALLRTETVTPALAMASSGVTGRVEALLAPRPSRSLALRVAIWPILATALVAVSSGLQLHHFGVVVEALCR